MQTRLTHIRNNLKTVAFLSAVLSAQPCLSQEKTAFLTPQDNTFSLQKVFVFPFLQTRPVDYVWNAGTDAHALAEYLKSAFVKEQDFEQQAEALMWRLSAAEQKQEFDDERAEVNDAVDTLADFSSAVYPETDALALNFIENLDRVDLEASDMISSFESSRSADEKAQNWAEYTQGITGLALIDVVYAQLDSVMGKLNRAADAALSEKADDVVDDYAANPDIYAAETQGAGAVRDFELADLGLLVNDLVDIGTGLDVTEQDAALWDKYDLALDTPSDFAKIRKSETDEKERLLNILKKAMKRKGEK